MLCSRLQTAGGPPPWAPPDDQFDQRIQRPKVLWDPTIDCRLGLHMEIGEAPGSRPPAMHVLYCRRTQTVRSAGCWMSGVERVVAVPDS